MTSKVKAAQRRSSITVHKLALPASRENMPRGDKRAERVPFGNENDRCSPLDEREGAQAAAALTIPLVILVLIFQHRIVSDLFYQRRQGLKQEKTANEYTEVTALP